MPPPPTAWKPRPSAGPGFSIARPTFDLSLSRGGQQNQGGQQGVGRGRIEPSEPNNSKPTGTIQPDRAFRSSSRAAEGAKNVLGRAKRPAETAGRCICEIWSEVIRPALRAEQRQRARSCASPPPATSHGAAWPSSRPPCLRPSPRTRPPFQWCRCRCGRA